MKKRILAILAFSCCLLAVGCTNSGNENLEEGLAADLAETNYEYTYDRPFYSTPDENMTIDGVFDEKEWEDCVWMQTTQYDVTYKVTTLFTQKGIYVAAYAEDPNIIWKGRNNFINNSSFEIQIVKEDSPEYWGSRWQQHFMNDFMFHADSHTCRSYRERQFNGAVKCVGTPNSGNTTSLSYEMFLGWDQMHYDESELNPETGIPDSVRIWCQYIMIDPNSSAGTKYISPFLMDYGRYTSYYEFGPRGIINRPDNGVVGSAIAGTTCTDRWIMDNNEEGGALKVDRYQTQHIWFTHDGDGNEVSRPTSFIVDAQVTADVSSYTSGQATFGIMTIHDMWSMVTYGVNMSNLINGKSVVLQSIEGIDSSYWVGQQSLSKQVATNYTDNTICLRLIKQDGYYYYYYKNPADEKYTYIGYEYWRKNSNDVDVGLFTNCPSTITNYSVTNYTGREDELLGELGEAVYFIDNTGVRGGDINVNDVILRHGDTLTITATPDNGYILNTFVINGEDRFDDFVEANGRLTIVPEADIAIEAEFVKIPREYLHTITYGITDDENNPIAYAEYTITNSNPLLSKTGKATDKGYIRTSMPTVCEFTINGRTYVSDGNYTLSLSRNAYFDVSESFSLTEDITGTLAMRKTLWGQKPTVNDKSVSGTYGKLIYNEDTSSYYAMNTTVKEYYTNTKVVDGEYIYTCTATSVPTLQGVTVNPVIGLVVASGSNASAINFKSAWWETNRLCIEINGAEISISGFKHSLNNNNKDSQIIITVARANDVLYLYDATGALVVTLDKDGVHPYEGRTIVNTSGLATIQAKLKEFFANGKENVCGPLVIAGTNTRVDFSIETSTDDVVAFIYGGNIILNDNSIAYESDKALSTYVKGETVRLYVWGKDSSTAVSSLLLTYDGGSETIDGSYDPITGKTLYTFIHDKGNLMITKNEEVSLDTISGQLSDGGTYSSTVICFSGAITGTYSGMVQSDGYFTFKVPQGELGMAFICGDALAISNVQNTSALNNLSIRLQKNSLLVGVAVVNGKTITSKAVLDFETYRKIANDEAFSVSSTLNSMEFGVGRSEYALLFSNSVSSNDFTITNVASSTMSYGKFGVAITDGEHILAVQLGTGGSTNTLEVRYGTWGEGGRFNLNRYIATYTGTGINAHNFNNIELKVVKTNNGIEIYVGTTKFATITNVDIGEEFFKENKEYCCSLVSTQLAGIVDNKVSIS